MSNTEELEKVSAEGRRKRLEFTCPHCGGHKLEELVLMRYEIEAVYDPCDPNYDWSYDWDDNIEPGTFAYSIMNEGNVYRCYNCEVPLRDEDGDIRWGGEFLIEWLKANCKQEES
ncbi:MAG: hypothetical protein ACLQPD_14765 [Desulfomonilaceae bacterium]